MIKTTIIFVSKCSTEAESEYLRSVAGRGGGQPITPPSQPSPAPPAAASVAPASPVTTATALQIV